MKASEARKLMRQNTAYSDQLCEVLANIKIQAFYRHNSCMAKRLDRLDVQQLEALGYEVSFYQNRFGRLADYTDYVFRLHKDILPDMLVYIASVNKTMSFGFIDDKQSIFRITWERYE